MKALNAKCNHRMQPYRPQSHLESIAKLGDLLLDSGVIEPKATFL